MTIEEALQFLQAELSHLPECREESLRILEHCTGMRRFDISLQKTDLLKESAEALCHDIAYRRKKGEPLAHILGYFWFYKH
ncbi:MAG: hypothetical protein ACRCY4_04070, partial [Brevinema sp.]